jgi:hypothetical protein
MPINTVLSRALPTHMPPVVLPESSLYDTARRAWNLTADQRPAAVCVATSVEHVQAAIAYARSHDLTVAAQTTGHLGQALPSLERTLLLRTALHDGEVEVDPAGRVARIKAGALWGDVVEAVAPHGLAVMHGSSPTVGVIGYLLGGGLSFYGREHGLAVNHVRAFEVVTPDGTLRRVDHENGSELFWALRGGGGGYAIVTAVELGLLPYAEVTAGALFFAASDGPAVLRAWRDWTLTAPSSMTTTMRRLFLPPLPEVPEPLRLTPVFCVDGVALEDGVAEELEARLRAVAEPILGGFGPMPSAAVVRLHGDPEDPVPCVGDSIILRELDDAAIDAFLAVAGGRSPLVSAELRHTGGALSASPDGAGVRGHLEGEYVLFGVGVAGMPGGPTTEQLEGFLDGYVAAMTPWGTGTRFSSFAERSSSLATLVPDASLPRLAQIRAAVDPGRLLVAPHLVPAFQDGAA